MPSTPPPALGTGPGPTAPLPRGALMALAAGGIAGSLARWAVGSVLPVQAEVLPWSTLLVNVAGALLLGLLAGTLGPGRPLLRTGLGAGVLGGFTTFSTLEVELRALASAGALGLLTTYAVASLLLGPLAAWVGLRSGEQLAGVRRT